MSEMIERVAKAHAFARRSRHDQARDAEHYWENMGHETQATEVVAARAVLEAIEKAGFVIVPREPSEEMLCAAERFVVYDPDTEGVIEGAADVWQAMIDKALETAK